MRRPALICFLLSLYALSALAQSQNTEHTLSLDDPSKRPSATLDDVSWMVGSWVGEGLGGQVEEVWAAPSAGSMLGLFKAYKDGKPSFYEFFALVEEEGSLILKLKHFHPNLDGWEAKDDYVSFPLVAVEEGVAYFGGLTYRLVAPDEMHAHVAVSRGDEMGEFSFVYHRVLTTRPGKDPRSDVSEKASPSGG